MSGVEAGIWAEGTYINGHYVNPADYRACLRCGITRRVRPGSNDLCVDCKTVERYAAKDRGEPVVGRTPVKRPGGIVRFEPLPQPMSAEDRAWCEQAAERAWWATWERTNRAGTTSEATVQQAIRKVS